jgi:hypothetical protein
MEVEGGLVIKWDLVQWPKKKKKQLSPELKVPFEQEIRIQLADYPDLSACFCIH